jgi:hypothetical protein
MIRLRLKDKGGEDYFKLRFGYFFAVAGILLGIWLLAGLKFSEVRDISICILAGVLIYVLQKLIFPKPVSAPAP